MAHPNVELIQRMWQCFATGDLDTVRKDVYDPDVTYSVPGHHPLAGTKVGIEEVLDFYKALAKANVDVKPLKLGEVGPELVVDVHHAHGEAGGAVMDGTNCIVYHIKNGKIYKVDCYNGDQHAIDNFFCAAFQFKPLPEAIAGTILE